MSRSSKPDKKHIEQYDHRGKERCNNPPVCLVTPATAEKRPADTTRHLDPAFVRAGKAVDDRVIESLKIVEVK